MPLFRKPTFSEHLEKGRGGLRELFKENFFKAPKKATGPHIFQMIPKLFLGIITISSLFYNLTKIFYTVDLQYPHKYSCNVKSYVTGLSSENISLHCSLLMKMVSHKEIACVVCPAKHSSVILIP